MSVILSLVALGLFLIFMNLWGTPKAKVKGGESKSNPAVLTRGMDIDLAGKPQAEVVEGNGKRFALCPPNFHGISPIPKVVVTVGDQVKAGDVIFFDKKRPEIKYVAPVSGEVIEVNRGAKRSIAEVVILSDSEVQYRDMPAIDWKKANRKELVAYLEENGVWPSIRQRPYNIVADGAEVPTNIFISTFDTAPLATDNNVVVQGREADFQTGLDVLGRLTSGKVYLGLNAKDNNVSAAFADANNVEKRWFKGAHPAGNVGVQIHHITPVDNHNVAWTLGVQDVITLGALMNNRRYDASRVFAVAGNAVEAPKYVRSYMGANMGDLVANAKEVAGTNRIISGDVLSGTKQSANGFVSYYDDQVTVIPEGEYHEMFGWLLPGKATPTGSKTFIGGMMPKKNYEADTNNHGEKRAFVVTGEYEKYLPMDVYPQHLLKSIIVGDLERMEGLGLYELVEEDLALCEFACTSKQPLQKILRDGLTLMQEQG